MNKLYIWTQDHSWAGIVVVVAPDEQEARKLLSAHDRYSDTVKVEKHEIENGLTIVNLGDC